MMRQKRWGRCLITGLLLIGMGVRFSRPAEASEDPPKAWPGAKAEGPVPSTHVLTDREPAPVQQATLESMAPRGTDIFVPLFTPTSRSNPDQPTLILSLTNLDNAPAKVQFFLLKFDQGNPNPAVFNDDLAAGERRCYPAPAGIMFAHTGSAVIRIVSDRRLVVTSLLGRSVSDSPAHDSSELSSAPVPAGFSLGAGERTRILPNSVSARIEQEILGAALAQPREREAGNSIPDFSWVESNGGEASLRLTAHDDLGNVLASKEYHLSPFEPVRENAQEGLGLPGTKNMVFHVEVVSGSGRVIAFGSKLETIPANEERERSGDGPLSRVDTTETNRALNPGEESSLPGKVQQGGSVTGSGQAGVIPVWTGPTALGSSQVVQQGESVAIGGFFDSSARFQVSTSSQFAAITALNSGNGVGISGRSQSLTGVAGTSESGTGVVGNSRSGRGVQGNSDMLIGVFGESNSGAGVGGRSMSGNGVQGESQSARGVAGKSASGEGVLGESTSSIGVQGRSQSDVGVAGASNGDAGVEGTGSPGVRGEGTGGAGVEGSGNPGVKGEGTGGPGVEGSGNPGLKGTGSGGAGVEGSGNPGIKGTGSGGAGVEGSGNPGLKGTSTSGAGVEGSGNPGVKGTSAAGPGVTGESQNGDGVFGNSTGGRGLHGRSSSGAGVLGESMSAAGVIGQSNSAQGVLAISNSGQAIEGSSESGTGIKGKSSSGAGVWGESVSNNGVVGYSQSNSAVRGESQSGTGVVGISMSGGGVQGQSESKPGVTGLSTNGPGVQGESTGSIGVFGKGTKDSGVWGESTEDAGVYGESDTKYGVQGVSDAYVGVTGNSMTGWGVQGVSDSEIGVNGFSKTSRGVQGQSDSGTGVAGLSEKEVGVAGFSTDSYGVQGVSEHNRGVVGFGKEFAGVQGQSVTSVGVVGISEKNRGVEGLGATVGVAGLSEEGEGVGAVTRTGIGLFAGAEDTERGRAANFNGHIVVAGLILGGVKAFRIDHPLDPANRYLNHISVESPEMKNLYDGVVMLDGQGEAVVQLPEWFEALNQDFRYQLTCVGGFAPVYVAEKMRGNRFKIAGGAPGLEISWQVTAVRHDAFALAHPIPVEEDKAEGERGYYLYPRIFGRPVKDGILWRGHQAIVAPWEQSPLDRGTAPASPRLTEAKAIKPLR